MKQKGADLYILERNLVRRDFNTAAHRYEESAILQRNVSNRLDERLDLISIRPDRILDLGSGTGMSAKKLSKRYRGARVYQVDFAVNMLRLARQGSRRLFSRQAYLCADAESLPMAAGCMDMVFSSLMLQWCMAPGLVFSEACRVLSPGGLLIFSSLGPDTLYELRNSWKAVDDTIHVNAFIDMHDLGDALVHNGYTDPVMEMEYIKLNYEDVFGLMRDLKQLGAHNINQGRRRTLTGKSRLARMVAEYEKSRREGKLPATYEVIYGHAWKREASVQSVQPGSQASIPLSSIKRRRPAGVG